MKLILLAILATLLVISVFLYKILRGINRIFSDKEAMEKNILVKLWYKILGKRQADKEEELIDFSYTSNNPWEN